MTLERPHLPACASLHADRLLRWSVGASVSVSWGYPRGSGKFQVVEEPPIVQKLVVLNM